MDQFPQMLYKAGGPEQIHGANFSTLVVNDAEEHAAAVADGWCETTPDALDAQQAEKERAARAAAEAAAKLAEQAGDTKPVTREELEQKATELGIPFSPRVSDKKLGEAIAAKLAEQAGDK